MEEPSAFRTSDYEILSSLSAGSLDVGQLIDANTSQPLLLESLSCASLTSSSSSVIPPAFPLYTVPHLNLVSLGEHLKMFPAVLPGTDKKSGHRMDAPVVLTCPTPPRLRSMCEECLSISKWAEYSNTRGAPGHVPWESILECDMKKWVPEGSLFSPESFSLALSQARNSRRDSVLRSHNREAWVHEDDEKTRSPSLSASNHDLDSALLGMMRELQDLRSYFEGTLQADSSRNTDADQELCVPALVVSTSHFTFPLALESFQDLTQHSSIAYRRGKSPPQPLKIGTETPSSESEIRKTLLNPLGPEEHTLQPADSSCEKSTFRVEEMIDNLRLQCSTMSLRSPPIDALWNSRSAITSPSNVEHIEIAGPGQADESKTLARNRNHKQPQTTSQGVRSSGALDRRYRGSSNLSRTTYKPRATTLSATSSRPLDCQKRTLPHPGSSIKQAALRPALMKDRRPQRPLKRVRFVLPRSEIKDDPDDCQNSLARRRETKSITETRSTCSVDLKLSHSKIAAEVTAKNSLTASPPAISSPNTQTLKSNKRLTSNQQPKEQVKPAVISSPVRKIALSRGSVEWKAGKTLWRSNTLGRHSLSKIIKSPVFAFRENKRATISIETTFETKVDENALRRQSDVIPSSAKNRMPMQFKNIFSRFK